MCAKHNLRNSDRRVHLEDYLREIGECGELMVKSFSDLVDLTWASPKALGYYAKAQPGQERAETSDGARQSSKSRRSSRGHPSATGRRVTIAAWGYGVASSLLVWDFSNSFHSRPCGGGGHQPLVHRIDG